MCYNNYAERELYREVRSVKDLFKKYSGVVAAFAMVVTTLVANSTCIYIMYQDQMPESAKKLRKF